MCADHVFFCCFRFAYFEHNNDACTPLIKNKQCVLSQRLPRIESSQMQTESKFDNLNWEVSAF